MIQFWGLICFFVFAAPSTSKADSLFRGRLPYAQTVPSSDRYPEEVALFSSTVISEGYDLILHFHGFREKRASLGGRLENFDDVLKEFNFDSLLTNSGRAAVLAVPSSLRECETYLNFLTSTKKLSAFFEALVNQVGARPGRIILVGHSGAYQVIASLLNSALQKSISEVYLLDATYGASATFAQFSQSNLHRLVSVYRQGTPTANGSYSIWKLLHPNAPTAEGLEGFYQTSMPQQVQSWQIPQTGSAFIVTSGDHWKVVNDFWSRLIALPQSLSQH